MRTSRRAGLYNSASGFTVTLSKSEDGYYYENRKPDSVQYSINGGNYIVITSLDTNIILTGVKTIQFKGVSTDMDFYVEVGTTDWENDIVYAVNRTDTSSVITLTGNITYYCMAAYVF